MAVLGARSAPKPYTAANACAVGWKEILATSPGSTGISRGGALGWFSYLHLVSQPLERPSPPCRASSGTRRTAPFPARQWVLLAASGVEHQTVTGPDGRFTLTGAPEGNLTMVVRAGGFAEWTESVGFAREVSVVLKLAPLLETVTVTATRSEKRLGDIPVSANIVEKETIRQSPAVVADDVLRQVPTFSLFRRSSSLSSHPTAQGVSLRGIGPSGVSRTLVLVDGVPFNDPFGGWRFYWTRVPLESVDRIEVIDGSSSSLYGNYGMVD